MLYGWMKSLIIYLIMSGLVINLAPGSNYKRYIGFFTGLIVIIIISEPISYIFNISGGDIDKLVTSVEGYMDSRSSLETQDNIYDYYDMSLSQAIKYSLMEAGYEVSDIEIITDDREQILKCTVSVEGELQEISETGEINIKKHISDVYNVDFDSIYIVRR